MAVSTDQIFHSLLVIVIVPLPEILKILEFDYS